MKKIILLCAIIVLSACSRQEITPTVRAGKHFSIDDSRVVILVDGKQVSSDILNTLDPNTIQSIDVIKNQKEIEKYTNKKVEGIVSIHLKKS